MNVIMYASRKYDHELIQNVRDALYEHWPFKILDLIVLFDTGSTLLCETPTMVRIISPAHTKSAITMTRLQTPEKSSHFDAFGLFNHFEKIPGTQLVFIENSLGKNSIGNKILTCVLENNDGYYPKVVSMHSSFGFLDHKFNIFLKNPAANISKDRKTSFDCDLSDDSNLHPSFLTHYV